MIFTIEWEGIVLGACTADKLEETIKAIWNDPEKQQTHEWTIWKMTYHGWVSDLDITLQVR